MTSVQRFLGGHNNAVREAALMASSVRAASAIERVAALRAGGGRVRLEGPYVGHEATDIEVEVVAAGGVPRASVPTFAGVGNGRLTVLDVDAAAPLQALTFTLRGLGVQTQHARLDVREVVIRARTSGEAGNSIRVTVTPSLTRTATAYALLADWQAGTRTQTGEQWDFGGRPASTSGELDPASPRVQFGADPTVYRVYREYKNGAWHHGLSPVMERTARAGTRVWAVEGGYAVTVTDGTTVETYADVVTFFDLLLALAGSALVEVAGVVAADRRVGGQAAVDVPLRTAAWLLAVGGRVALEDVAVPSGAPTQSLTVRCVNADVVGAERWSVAGTVSGELRAAVTGALYTSAAASFLVPPKAPAKGGDGGEWSFKYAPQGRDDEEGLPSVCVRPFRFGRNARPRSVTFRYQKRPPAECQCSDMPTPRLSMKCLGIEGESEMTLAAEYKTRLEALYEYRRDFHAGNVGRWRAVPKDLDYMDAIADVFAEALAEIHESEDARAEWDLALTEMQGFVGPLQGRDGVVHSTAWGLGVSHHIVNRLNGHFYLIVAATYAGGVADTYSAALPAWSDSVFWKTDASTFTHTEPASGQHPEATVTLKDVGTTPPAGQDLLPVEDSGYSVTHLVRKYRARMDYCRTLAGIVPKSDASIDAGACWRDHPDESHWWADVDGYYLPAFNNEAYVSSRRNTETGRPFSTMEFGFGLVVACPGRLKEGDTLTIRILTVDADRPYQVGDEAVIETVAAGPAWLAGGVDGTDELTWSVWGSQSGVLPDYVVPLAGPVPTYAQAGLAARMALGGIPFALGDAFSLAVEAGQLRWRRDGAAWSAEADIPADGVSALADGVSAVFEPGAAPSFVPGDRFVFRVHQPHAASHVRRGTDQAWAWVGAAATLDIDLGSAQAVSAVALARYALPASAAVTVALSEDGVAWSAPLALDVSRAVSVRLWAPQPARYVRVSVADAAGGSIGWVWAGEPASTTHHASRCEPMRRYAVTRGNAPNPAALYAGRGVGWSVVWDQELCDADVQVLLALVDWMQVHDEPVIFVPHHLHPGDAALVRAGSDALELPDLHHYQPNDAGHRLVSAALALDPVLA